MDRTYNRNLRIIIILIMMFIILGLFTFGLIKMQIVEGANYLQQSQNRVSSKTSIIAPRGEISDRLGRPFVINSTGITIKIEKPLIKKENLNTEILNLVKLFELSSEPYIDTLPISKSTPFEFITTQASDATVENTVPQMLKFLKLDKAATAMQVIESLKQKYSITGFSQLEVRKIAGVRYEMETRGFSDIKSFTFAQNVTMPTVTLIKENSGQFVGVNVEMEPIRQYVTPGIASHILGRIGRIYAEEYPDLKSKGYALDDIVGKDGIEKTCEQYLKGIDGTKQIDRDINGKITQIIEAEPAVPGNNVFLTLDKNLQTVAEESLKRTIPLIAQNAKKANKSGFDANAGAVVAVDVNSGEILALSSYPTYDLSNFNKDYSLLIKNALKPMLNRAIGGVYAPGSSFKPVTAIAALETNALTVTSTYTCHGIYDYFKSYRPSCYNKKAHGTETIVEAIKNSCNVFFFETGRLTGIDAIDKYATKFGLGQITGVELTGETKGILSGKAERIASGAYGGVWNPGDTIQTAIGQSDNLFTPIQLAGYVATIANGGTRYKLHIVKSVKSYYYGETILENKPQVVEKISIKPQNYAAVVEGMKKVALEGTARGVFRDFKMPIAAKTGTAQVPSGSETGVLIAFSPIVNPQIAVVVVVEHAGLGEYTAPVVKDIMNAYFAAKDSQDKISQEGVLLK